MPILSSTRPTRYPARPSVSTMMIDRPRERSAGSVRTTSIRIVAIEPLVMNIFEPLITYWSPSRTARVRMPFRSDPAPGSVIAIAPISSPRAIRGSQRLFCSGVP